MTNLVYLLLMTHFGSEKLLAKLDHSHLCQNAEFWNYTKIRPGKFNFHAVKELVIHSYKAHVIAMIWIIVRRKNATMGVTQSKSSSWYWVDNELTYLDHWLQDQPAFILKEVMDKVHI